MSDEHRTAHVGLDAGPPAREPVPLEHAIAANDLADTKQMGVVTDQDSKVLARAIRSGAAPGTSVWRWTGPATGRRRKASQG